MSDRPRSPQTVPDNREAVIAIQGGGVYALPMLGQVRAILAAGYVPLGFAGSSGGAILATLLWSGLTPNQIESAFTEFLRTHSDGLARLLLPRSPANPPFTLGHLRAVPALLGSLLPLPRTNFGLLRTIWLNRGALRNLSPAFTQHWSQRGVFGGEQFTDLIERLVQEGLDIRRAKPITFGDVQRHSRRRPPLLLTVTNVSQGRLELIDSTDPGYADVSVASAVRASAGFPIIFRPIDLLGAGAGRCFVDGGMVANFPLWAFSRTFREKLQQREDYGWLAPRPWLPIGLRVRNESDHMDVSAPSAFFRRLAAIASGMARNDMEDRLVAATQTNAIFITQGSSSLPRNPRTGHPIDVLDMDAVTPENIGAIIQTGEDAANRWLVASGNYTIFDRECGSAVEDCLEDIVRRCEHAMQLPPMALNLRANVFMAVGHRLEMRFSARMTSMRDDGLQFPDLATGVNGWCYQTRSPALCNLDSVSDIAGAGSPARRPFNMSMDLQNRIQADRTWLISYPIFDPGEMQSLRTSPRGWSDVYAPGIHRLASDLIGPIVGILNVDAGWNYDAIGLDPRPDVHASDPRIITVIDTVAQACLRLARLLVRPVPSE